MNRVQQLVETMADVEARIAKIYERFATEFRDVADVGDLWMSMGSEELRHAGQLSTAASQAPDTSVPEEVTDHLAALETIVLQYEQRLARPIHLQEALQATVALEEAEAIHLHASLDTLGEWGQTLARAPAMQHTKRGLLEHAIRLYGTPALQNRLVWHRFQD